MSHVLYSHQMAVQLTTSSETNAEIVPNNLIMFNILPLASACLSICALTQSWAFTVNYRRANAALACWRLSLPLPKNTAPPPGSHPKNACPTERWPSNEHDSIQRNNSNISIDIHCSKGSFNHLQNGLISMQ